MSAAAMWATPSVPSGGQVVPRDATWSGKAAYDRGGRKRQVGLRTQVLRWPIVTAGNANGNQYQRDRGRKGKERPTLVLAALTGRVGLEKSNTPGKRRGSWSTPKAHDINGGKDMPCRGKPGLKTQIGQAGGRKLNPAWVEQLMGLPAAWTLPLPGCGRDEYRRWETASCRLLRHLLTTCCTGG